MTIRIAAELLALVDGTVARSVHSRPSGPWTRSSLITKAVEEFLKKMARSAGKTESPLPPTYRRNSFTF